MVMPLCGTFHYAGLASGTKIEQQTGGWKLTDQSGARRLEEAISPFSWKFLRRDVTRDDDRDPLRDNRLVGLEPILRISGRRLIIEARSRQQSQLRSASLDLAEALIDTMRGGDLLTLVRTGTADIGLSLLRRGELVFALGAVTVVPLGDNVRVRGGPALDLSEVRSGRWPREDTWVDVSVGAETLRLRRGEDATIGIHRFSVLQTFQEGMPGKYECLAVTSHVGCSHEAAACSAELLSGQNAGLDMVRWP